MSPSANSHEPAPDIVEFSLTPQQVPEPKKPRQSRSFSFSSSSSSSSSSKEKSQPQPRPLTISDAVALGPVGCLQALFFADNVIYMTSAGRKSAAELCAQQKGKHQK